MMAVVHCRVCEAVLKTLCGFVEWVPMGHILDDNSLLLRLLCLLLNDKSLQLMAAECLLLIVSRKVSSLFFILKPEIVFIATRVV